MTLPKKVTDALREVRECAAGFPVYEELDAISAHLLSHDAEIRRLHAIASHHRDGRLKALEHMAAFESRLAAAETLAARLMRENAELDASADELAKLRTRIAEAPAGQSLGMVVYYDDGQESAAAQLEGKRVRILAEDGS